MAIIVFPSTETVTDIIDSIRSAIGRTANFITLDRNDECSVCSLDPTTGLSIDSFCTTCSGLYYIPVYSGVTISGHVWWKTADGLQWPVGGQIFDGDATFQLKYTVGNLDIVNSTEFLMLDGKTMTIRKKVLRGVPDLNRIILTLDEEERNDT